MKFKKFDVSVSCINALAPKTDDDMTLGTKVINVDGTDKLYNDMFPPLRCEIFGLFKNNIDNYYHLMMDEDIVFTTKMHLTENEIKELYSEFEKLYEKIEDIKLNGSGVKISFKENEIPDEFISTEHFDISLIPMYNKKELVSFIIEITHPFNGENEKIGFNMFWIECIMSVLDTKNIKRC